MNEVQTTQVATEEVTVQKPRAAYLVYRESGRKRFSFGPAWLNAVLGGLVSDHVKLVEHAVSLGLGKRSDLKKLKFDTLLNRVQSALLAS